MDSNKIIQNLKNKYRKLLSHGKHVVIVHEGDSRSFAVIEDGTEVSTGRWMRDRIESIEKSCNAKSFIEIRTLYGLCLVGRELVSDDHVSYKMQDVK